MRRSSSVLSRRSTALPDLHLKPFEATELGRCILEDAPAIQDMRGEAAHPTSRCFGLAPCVSELGVSVCDMLAAFIQGHLRAYTVTKLGCYMLGTAPDFMCGEAAHLRRPRFRWVACISELAASVQGLMHLVC